MNRTPMVRRYGLKDRVMIIDVNQLPPATSFKGGVPYDETELEMLSDRRSTSRAQLSRSLGRTNSAIRTKLWRMKMTDSSDHWGQAQLDALRQIYTNAEYRGLKLGDFAAAIGKSESNVCRKARELGLTNRRRVKLPEDLSAGSKRRIMIHNQSPEEKRKKLSEAAKKRIKDYGHPRGSREKRVCPGCGETFEVPASNPKIHCCQACARRTRPSPTTYSRSISGRREDLGNVFFRSSYEANYARYLNFLIVSGSDVVSWEYEPQRFVFEAIKRGTTSYLPDFRVRYRDDHVEFHEVKGWDYPKGRVARERMAKYHPEIKLVLIDRSFFRAVHSKGQDKLIPGWESGRRSDR